MHAVSVLTDVFYPPVCLLCHTDLAGSSSPLCSACLNALPRCRPPVCTGCGIHLPVAAPDAGLICETCRAHPPAFDLARAPLVYADAAQETIQQFKYHRRWRLGRWLADAMVDCANTLLSTEDIDVVAPVPTHWAKRWLSGYYPTAILSRHIAQTLRRPYAAHALTRARWTRTQTRLSGAQRARNVQRAFTANRRSVDGRNILLIDDVLTSGSTADACAAALKAAGARRVFVLTAARTPWHLPR